MGAWEPILPKCVSYKRLEVATGKVCVETVYLVEDLCFDDE